ncbi:hypothetical protein CQW23_12776 [Capsicum baccatum]|uniref:Uncharacterized protein n=1 Tax=Capsicum baccatum TaxID=33114 RepID=A0A2G2WTH5_CAPBA|nr:hypothetical protein CQW23_12776 [Capsicum baccatum]
MENASVPFDLRLLRPEESWELLQKRVFGEEHCPDELKDVGAKIAQKCDGLPLVLDLIDGVISMMENKEALWLEVLNNLSFFIFMDEEEVMKVGSKESKIDRKGTLIDTLLNEIGMLVHLRCLIIPKAKALPPSFSNLCNLETLEVIANESFPMLEELEIKYYNKITEIPESFGDIASLKLISMWENVTTRTKALAMMGILNHEGPRALLQMAIVNTIHTL